MIATDQIKKRALLCPASLPTLTFLVLAWQAAPLAAQAPPPSALSTRQCADRWLETRQLELGANPHPDGSFDFVSNAEEQVQAQTDNPNWVLARQDAFEKARLNAMREMVAYFKEGVRSDNTVMTMLKGDAETQAPSETKPVDPAAATSPETSADNGETDTDGSEPKPPEQQPPPPVTPPSRGPTLSSSLRQQINAASEDVLIGVVVAQECDALSEADGTVTGGKYSVSVTLLWSTKLQKLAQSMFNSSEFPAVDHPEASPGNQPTLKERFAAAAKTRPEWMAYELGVRVYTDADGESVVVGFGAVPATSLKSADVSRADLMARNYIAEFQRTHVKGTRNADTRTSYSENGVPGKGQFSNGTDFADTIEEKTPMKQLTGIYPLAAWRGRHPESDKQMVVVARAWKRSAQAQAQKISPTQGLGINGPPETASPGKASPPAVDGMAMGKGDF